MLAMSSRHLDPAVKLSRKEAEDNLRTLTGNSQAIVVIARLLAGLLLNRDEMHENLITKLWAAWRVAEKAGAAAPARLSWGEKYGPQGERPAPSQLAIGGQLSPEQRLVYHFLGKSSNKGTDVQFTSGEAHCPDLIQRQPVLPHFWRWRVVSSYPWRSGSAHINNLEVTAYLDLLRKRSRDASCHGERFLALLDSQVGIGVLAKGRTSSHSINALLKRVAALVIGSGFLPVYGWSPSDLNPSDGPSRWPAAKRRRLGGESGS